MKKLLFLLCVLLFASCSTEEDPPEEFGLNGKWYLVNISCFCAFDEDIALRDFKLYFREAEKTVQLVNPSEDYYYIADSGTYQYMLQGDRLLIAGAAPFIYAIEGAELILTLVDDPGIADDELVLRYRRG